MGLSPGLGISPGVGNRNSLQYTCLENPIERGTWWVHGAAKSQTGLSARVCTHTHTHTHSLTHSFTKGVGQGGLSCPLAPSGSLNRLSLEQFFLSANFRRRCVCVSRGAGLVWVLA